MGLRQDLELLRTRSATARWLSGVLAGVSGDNSFDVRPEIETDRLIDRLAAVRRLLSVESSAHRKSLNLEAREAERIRLMVNAPGGIPAPPYGSWWMEQTMNGRSTLEVSEYYGLEGLKHHSEAGPADYLPSELEFIHFLIQHQLAAISTRQEELAVQAARRQGEFLERFMLPWIHDFCRAGKEATEDRFWMAVFGLLEDFVLLEAGRLEAGQSAKL